ncbi:hypothetical protein LP316_07800 [Thalassotalea sp. LPB0316]|uniref:hypothetical protein n=1 Tax=Thalassotalea sp. LPB0316 TaxID=2769490 RepID=UPI00186688B2|nr:hypothetical protein [Thalassotalea sp. LPB0316]QOL27178.1 hypothetical protein LP316_07800 [Thalassotalea sp. LPB0316]
MNELLMKVKILFRSEMMLLKSESNRRVNTVLLSAISIGALLIGVVFFNIGLFFKFTEQEVYSSSAFWLALLNLVIAAIPLLIAKQIKPGAQDQMIEDIRNMAMDELTQDFNKVNQEVEEVGQSIKNVKSSISNIGSGSLTGMGPLLGLAIDLLKKK